MKDDAEFAKIHNLINKNDKELLTIGYVDGYMEGQEHISPKVLNLLERIKYHMRYSPGIYAPDITAEIENLLAKE